MNKVKHFFTILVLLFSCISATAQPFNNEWIDYSKTYYKFKVGATGLYRINQATLSTTPLAGIPVEQLQMWRNGVQVPIFTSVPSGTLPAGGYIEFWGEKNDGKADKALYKSASNFVNDRVSLQTDTAAYFLTVNTNVSANVRYVETTNDVAGNTLPAEEYFIHKARIDYTNQIHRGRAVYYGEYVYSSTYDTGEMWSSTEINPANPLTHSFQNLFASSTGPTARLNVYVAGSSIFGSSRTAHLAFNNTTVQSVPLANFEARFITHNNIPLSSLIPGTVDVKVSVTNTNPTGGPNDRIVVNHIELQYPRVFNFGGLKNFEFELPPSQGNYLEISNFNAGSTAPVLYDLTNNKRYIAVVSGSVLKFALTVSSTSRRLILVSEDASNIQTVQSFETRNFINYASAANQGNFLIITNKIISNGGSAVQDYLTYRSSAAGGGYSAKAYDIEELVDQFAFGIKKHPLSIKNFLKWARQNFSASLKPQFALLAGKAVTYNQYRLNETSALADRLNLVPTFGWPASDVLLASDNLNPVAATPIGRLSIVSNQELADYLQKLRTYEQQQQSTLQTLENKAWMKNVLHVAGGNSPSLDATLDAYFNGYEYIIRDSLFGANVTRFSKSTTGPVTPITDALMEQSLEKGASIINYFGHSSATALDYALNNPNSYNNTGKYPVFVVNGCLAGDIFSLETGRTSTLATLSEIWVQAKNKGSIAFVASSHFGVTNYLDALNTGLYRSLSGSGYNKPISHNLRDAAQYLINMGFDSTTEYLHAEENILNGDPAIKINASPLPDYVVEQSKIVLQPSIISVADGSFKVKAIFYNIGKAVGKSMPATQQDSVRVTIKRRYPDGTEATVLQRNLRPPVRYVDSVEITLPILPIRDNGENRITVTIDADNKYNEMSESNNTATTIFNIIADELRPVFPYNYSIVSQQNIKFYASTADALGKSNEYRMELDTTALFNSPFKKTFSTTGIGGVIEFNTSGVTFTDSTVYYWRTAIIKDNNPGWNTFSFTYLNNATEGFGQKHFHQYNKNEFSQMSIDDDRVFRYPSNTIPVTIQHGNYPPNTESTSFVDVKNNRVANWGNYGWPYGTLQFVALNGVTLEALANGVNTGKWGSTPGQTRWRQFEYFFTNSAGRTAAANFIDSVPDGYYVIAYPMIHNDPSYTYPFVDVWKTDGGNSLYNKLVQHGISNIDSFNRKRPFIFVFKKNDPSFTPIQVFGEQSDVINATFNALSYITDGKMTTPMFGPATSWQNLQWQGRSIDPALTDEKAVQVIGVSKTGQEQLFATVYGAQDTTLSFINALDFPYIKLRMLNEDSVYGTPSQLRYWFVKGSYLPEGSLAANLKLNMKDSFKLGEPINFELAFKNISNKTFTDSLKVKITVTDKNNVTREIAVPKGKMVAPGDTLVIRTTIETATLTGTNTLHVFVNPENDQPEQSLFNNFLYKTFYVEGDMLKPVMDVTFDGLHILNNDVVSSKPHIVIKLKDESKFMWLDDTSNVTVYLVQPTGVGPSTMKRFSYGTDTLRFIGATPGSGDNTATVEFNPHLVEDGTYELWVKAKDRSGNTTGDIEHRVAFQVVNKAMISNVFNYPNPFTTSTAFVFTLTGFEVPQNLRIQILTITGKIVKEITKQELGPLRIGRNITEYKWDGTDQYGQQLANGVYLYRIITNHNGNSLEKYQTTDPNGGRVDTDKYFKGGYGKMYLMR